MRGPISLLMDLFEGDPDVRRVANDPALAAELLLLFRMILADGEVQEAELETLKRICRDSFGIADENGFRRVMGFLRGYGYETTTSQALAIFRDLPHDRRLQLARHLAEIAKADAELSGHEVRLLARTLKVLDLRPDELVGGAG